MRQHQPALVELALEPAPVYARLAGDRERALVDVDDAIEAGEVEHHAAAHGHGAALRPGAAAPRHHGHPMGVRDAEHGRHAGTLGDQIVQPRQQRAAARQHDVVDLVVGVEALRRARHVLLAELRGDLATEAGQ